MDECFQSTCYTLYSFAFVIADAYQDPRLLSGIALDYGMDDRGFES
jgi:hypothetical protein